MPPSRSYTTQQKWPDHLPLVSVVIPCYNYGRYIRGAIESVLCQTFDRFEIIVIDDGSTDALTKRILRELSYPGTRIVTQPNQGLAATRNNGALLASGKYVCYLDPDDFLAPAYLEKTLSLLEADASLGSCFSWVQVFGDRTSVWKTETLDPCVLKDRVTAPSHSVIRKAAWQDVRTRNGFGFLTKYDGYFEDWVFWIDMVECGYRGYAIKEPLIRYRVHADSLGARHKPGFSAMVATLHDDRARFFSDASYRRQMCRALHRRVYVQNPRINMDTRAAFYRTSATTLVAQKPALAGPAVQQDDDNPVVRHP